jgi:DNA helicase-2/ATP-dependent DNA helicase PcrA
LNNLLDNLNKEQLEAVKHRNGPLLIVAGAGTGKTTVITRRIAYLIEQKLCRPDEILALTFTEKAAGEMQERADLLLPLGYYDLWISTFHSFCERILKNHALDIGLPNDFKLLDDVQQWIFVYNNLDKFDLDYYKPLGSPNGFIYSLLKHFSRCKDELITPQSYLEHAQNLKLSLDNPEGIKSTGNQEEAVDLTEIKRREEVANAFYTYEKLMRDNNFLDFGDLINCTLELFKKRPQILKYYQNQFKFIMVDEFQDTNFAQYQLVKLLSDSHKNLVVVGDDDQSIYKFRGASVSNILKFKEDYANAQQITLLENYRSTQNILDLAYNFIQANNPDRLEVKLKIDKKLKSNSKGQGVIEVLEADDLSGELNSVAKKIIELKNADPAASWNDFAVLIRANSAADELLPVLAGAGIPYTFLANKGLYKKPIIVDIVSYMRLLNNAHDSAALYRVLQLPKFRLDHAELSSLLLYAKQKTLSLYESLTPAQTLGDISDEGKKKIKALLDCLSKHSSQTKNATAAEMMVEIVDLLGFETKLKADTLENADSRELLDQFYKKIEEFEKHSEYKDLSSFLKSLELEIEAGSEGAIKFDPNLGPESLKVMTIHSAKGLEFTNVFIINMVDQRFPTREKSEAIKIPDALVKDILPEGDFHLQEERRLFYVAATRARKHLYLTWAKDYGGTRAKKPSQFLLETKLVPSEKVSQATGKVIFSKAKNSAKNKIIYQNPPVKFSYSDLNNFEICPLRYKYASFLKLPLPGSYHASFGNTVHKTFEEFLKLYKNNQQMNQTDLFGTKPSESPLPDFKFLEKLYEKNWIDDWYESKAEKEKYRKEGKKMLKTFYEDLESQKPQTKYIEQFFKLRLGNFDFVGKIDRADIKDGGVEIIDYKTGKTPKSKKDIDQLYVYQWAAESFLREKVVSLKYWYLRDNEFKEEPKADDKEIIRLKNDLLLLMEKIVETAKYDRFKEEDLKLRQKGHECEFENLE